MDIAYYMAKVDAKVKNDREREQNSRDALMIQFNSLSADIEKLRQRILDILSVAKYCEKNGINLGDKYASAKHGYGNRDYSFMADGFFHHLGFCRSNGNSKASGLAILNGGACGNWDFHVDCFDSPGFYWRDHSNHYPGILREPPTKKGLRDMQDFIAEFPVFEKAFYSFVDSLS